MRAKKSLGQHFLKSKKIIDQIASEASRNNEKAIVEIGPGKGVLTRALLNTGKRVVAVEKDDRLITPLREMFARELNEGRLSLIHGDILKTKLTDMGTGHDPYIVVANIPYYITGAILKYFLDANKKPERMILMVQKEVADRIIARNKKGSILSLSVAVYGTPVYLATVPARFFTPPPHVDSALIAINAIRNPFKTPEDAEIFFHILKQGFAHKRKLLKGNLSCAEQKLSTCNLSKTARPEELLLSDWLCLSQTISRP